MIKNRRHKMIREIIENQNIETQCHLMEELQKHGFDVTQATISRDIKELGLIKVASHESSFRYSFPQGFIVGNTVERAKRMLRDNLLKVEVSHFIVIVKALPGTAPGVASCIDGLGWKEIAGCVAGDDTIMMVTRSNEDALKISENIQSLTQ